MPGIVPAKTAGLRFADWNCGAGQNNVIVRTDGTVGPCFPMYGATHDWGNIEGHKFHPAQIAGDCFSTLNHNLGYCYNDARVIKWLWKQARNGVKGGARSFED